MPDEATTNWDTQLADLLDELSAQVDFVVLGGTPYKPASESEYGAEDTDRDRRQRRAYDDYMSQVKTAEVLAIPRLTQSVLLNFLGYNSAQAIDFGDHACSDHQVACSLKHGLPFPMRQFC